MTQPSTLPPRIMTVLEARVPQSQWPQLQQVYQASLGRLPPQMVRTMLVQSTNDPEVWRGISIWRSQAALAEYRQSAQTPEGIVMFRSAGAEPALTLFELIVESDTP